MRLAILFERLGPYHHARLRAAGRLCDLTAIEISTVDNTYAWAPIHGAEGFRRTTLFTDAALDDKSSAEIRRALWQALEECDPQVVSIPGWATVPAYLALEWCRLRKIPAIVMSDSQEIDEQRVWWKEWVKSQIVRQFSAGFVAGARHKDYLGKLGLAGSQVFTCYDVVDNAYFSNGSDVARKNGYRRRADLGLPNNYFLNSSRFVEKKNLAGLIEAYANYIKKAGADAWHLVILGDGPLRPQLEEQICSLNIGSQIHLPGFKQYDELPDYYGLSGAYIQSSTTEQWGLVVNEAMASGLAVLISNHCGCAPDLVHEGVNGYTFDPYDIDSLAKKMLEISSEKKNLTKMGIASRSIIANWSPEKFAESLVQAAKTAKSTPLPEATLLSQSVLKALILRY